MKREKPRVERWKATLDALPMSLGRLPSSLKPRAHQKLYTCSKNGGHASCSGPESIRKTYICRTDNIPYDIFLEKHLREQIS